MAFCAVVTSAGAQDAPPIPAISPFGVVHGASNTSGLSPKLPRGGIFLVRGAWLGPDDLVLAEQPLSPGLADSRLEIRSLVDNTVHEADMLHAWAFQVAGIMPLGVSAGMAELTVTYQGRPSAPVEIEVVDVSPGLFAVSQRGFGPGVIQNFDSPGVQPLNTLTNPASPGQFIILWGTGLGELHTEDDVVIRVGSMLLRPSYAGPAPGLPGVDQYNVFLPEGQDLERGCYVSVSVIGNGHSNGQVSVAVSDSATSCDHPWQLSQDQLNALDNGERLKKLFLRVSDIDSVLLREQGELQIRHATIITADVDLANATGVALASRPQSFLPTSGGTFCFSTGGAGGVIFGEFFPSLPQPPAPANPPAIEADAGDSLIFSGPGGQLLELLRDRPDAVERNGGFAQPYQFFEPDEDVGLPAGSWTLSAPGGDDVGAFTVAIELPALPAIAPPATLDFREDISINWPVDGFADDDELSLHVGVVVEQILDGREPIQVPRTVGCSVKAVNGSVTIPADLMGSLPPPKSATGLWSLRLTANRDLTIAGIDYASVDFSAISSKGVPLEAIELE